MDAVWSIKIAPSTLNTYSGQQTPGATIDPLPAKGKKNEPKAYFSGNVDVGWMPV
jgi:hypothetical protein